MTGRNRLALILFIPEWLTWWTTEIAVTNHRFIYKAGVMRRTTTEIPIDRVESVDIEQSLIGRLLGYGTVIVHATGTGFEPLQGIAHPIKLQNQLPALDSQIAMLHHSTFGMAGGARCSGCCLGTGLLTSNGRHPCRLRTIVDHEASKSCRRIRDLPRCSGEPIAGTVARERGRVSV